MTEREVQEIIDEVDENKDGRLDYKEVNTPRNISITQYIF